MNYLSLFWVKEKAVPEKINSGLTPTNSPTLFSTEGVRILTDPERLAALASYGILGTEAEAAFDDIACLAAKICGVPTAFVSFVDDTQQFFKASVGAGGVREVPVQAGFCPFTVAKQDVLVIPDTLVDPLYAHNLVVTNAPFVRFYAGIPLRSPEGHVLGTVCVVDQKPQELGDEKRDALRILGRQVENLLALRRSVYEQAQAICERDNSSIARALAEEARRHANEEREQTEARLRESEATLREREQRIKILYELTSRADLTFTEKVQGLLHAGREWLGMDLGVLARTDCDAGQYTIMQIDAAGEAPPAGFTCPLEKTFCAETVKGNAEDPPLTVEDAGAHPDWRGHAAYEAFGNEAYIAAIVRVNNQPWGTIAFCANKPRLKPFTDFDKDIVRLRAQWIGGELSRQAAEDALRTNVVQQKRFVREMLASVTEGKLCLCDSSQELSGVLPPVSDVVELTPATLRTLRKYVESVADALQLTRERTQDLVTAVGEAGMNAIRHGGGGTGRVHADTDHRVVQVWIQDHGKGIRQEDLHRATLEKGWSGSGSLGHGFYLMLRTVDRTYLLTGEQGTTVVLEQEAAPPLPAWLKGRANITD